MSAFHKEYVVTRRYPVHKLLHAFGVHLVGLVSIIRARDLCFVECPQLQNKTPTTMLYFLRVAMSHQCVPRVPSKNFVI